jgi:hypothetical protein
MAKFSDPDWWPMQTPKPPKAASAPIVVLGTLIPLVAIGTIVAIIVSRHNHSAKVDTGRSIAAFQACMKDEGADSPSVIANARLLQSDAVACKGHLPGGVVLPDFTQTTDGPPPDAQQAFAQCVRTALSGLGGGGRFVRPSRAAYQNALALCRSLTPGAPGQGRANA